MSSSVQAFDQAFSALAQAVRANVSDQELRPLIKPVQSAIHGLAPQELNPAFDRMAELALAAPMPQASIAVLLCGVFIENGGQIERGIPAILKRSREAIGMGAVQFRCLVAGWRRAEQVKGGRLTQEEASAINDEVLRQLPREEVLAVGKLPFFTDALLAVLERSKAVRKAVRADRGFVEDILMFAEQGNDSPAHLSKILPVLDDEELLVLHPETGRGYRVEIEGITHNFQLHTLLADALIGEAAQGLLPGPRPDPRVVAAAKDQPHTPDVPVGQACFHMQDWTTIRSDGSPDPSPFDHLIWHEGTPADIPPFEDRRVVILSKVTLPRSWKAPRDFTELFGAVRVLERLPAETVRQWLQRMAQAPRPPAEDRK